MVSATDLLSEKQERSIAHSTARINLWTGAVRSGKTISSLLRWLIYVANAPRGGALVVSGKTLDTVARNVLGPLQDPALFGPVAKHVRYTRGASTGTILGRPIEVITANDARSEGRLRGLTAAGAYCDELSLLPEEFFTQLLARLSVPGAMLFGTTNPASPSHWVRKKFLLRQGELDLRHWHFTMADNPSLTAKYVADISAEYTGLWYKRFIEGAWVQAEGAVFDCWDEDVHVVDVLPVISEWVALGVDYGTTNVFAGLLLGLGIDGKLYLTREYRYDSKEHHRQLTDVEYSQRLRTWMSEVPVPGTQMRGVQPSYVVVDPSAASFRAQLHADGLISRLGDNEVLPGIRNMASLLATRRLFVHRSCKGLIDEIPGYSWDDKKANQGEDAPIKADDHSIDASRYAIHTTRSVWRNRLIAPKLIAA